jgi:hypothetical protein
MFYDFTILVKKKKGGKRKGETGSGRKGTEGRRKEREGRKKGSQRVCETFLVPMS